MKRPVFLLSVFVVVALFAALPLDAFQDSREPASRNAQATFSSADGSVVVVVPGSWGELELNEEAILQVGNEAEEVYLVVLTDSKDDLFGWNLTRHSYITLGQIMALVDFPEVSGPVETSIGGREALQYEIRGAVSGTRIVYLHTTIESETLLTQILAWTLPSRWELAESALRDAIGSITITP